MGLPYHLAKVPNLKSSYENLSATHVSVWHDVRNMSTSILCGFRLEDLMVRVAGDRTYVHFVRVDFVRVKSRGLICGTSCRIRFLIQEAREPWMWELMRTCQELPDETVEECCKVSARHH